MRATLLLAVASLLLWLVLLPLAPPSGWLHVPLAVGTTLLVRWIALRDAAVSGEAPGTRPPRPT